MSKVVNVSSDLLILSPHIDDFILMAGAYVVKLSEFLSVHVIYMSNGINHEEDRSAMGVSACQKLGIPKENIHFLGFKNTMFTTQIIKPAYNMIQKFALKPYIILCPSNVDLNQDHQITNRLGRILARPMPEVNPIRLLAYETLSSTEWGIEPFQPNYYVEVTDYDWKPKEDALFELLPKLRDYPYPLSINGVMVKQQQRGMECGYNLAEAFQAIRWYG